MKYWSEKAKNIIAYDNNNNIIGNGISGDWIRLDTTNSPHSPPRAFAKQLRQTRDVMSPSPLSDEVRFGVFLQLKLQNLDKQGINIDNIFVSNSPAAVLAHSFAAFFSGRTEVLIPQVSHRSIGGLLSIYDIRAKLVRGDNFEIFPSDYANSQGVVISNPSDITGMALGLDKIDKILRNNTGGVVIIDETYIGFSNVPSAVSLVPYYDNLLVIKSIFKAYSAGGLNTSYAVGSNNLIEALRRVQIHLNPQPLGIFEQIMASYALQDTSYDKSVCMRIAQARDKYSDELTKIGYELYNSQANFMFVKIGANARLLYEYLIRNKVLVYYRNEIRFFMRITIGTDEQMRRLISLIKRFNRPSKGDHSLT